MTGVVDERAYSMAIDRVRGAPPRVEAKAIYDAEYFPLACARMRSQAVPRGALILTVGERRKPRDTACRCATHDEFDAPVDAPRRELHRDDDVVHGDRIEQQRATAADAAEGRQRVRQEARDVERLDDEFGDRREVIARRLVAVTIVEGIGIARSPTRSSATVPRLSETLPANVTAVRLSATNPRSGS